MADQVLKLSTTEFDRPTIEIDGDSYEMRAPDELGVEMMISLQELGEKITENKENIEKMARHVAESVDVVMVALPTDVRDKLTVRQQGRIISTFTNLVGDDNSASQAPDQASAPEAVPASN